MKQLSTRGSVHRSKARGSAAARRTVCAGALALSLTVSMAACSSSSSSDPASAAVNSTATAAVPVPTDAQLKKMMDLPSSDPTAGKTISIGALLPLSGSGLAYGDPNQKGLTLAAEQIKALGGPNFNIVYRDLKSGDPQAGISGVRDFASQNIHMMVSSYSADLGAITPTIQQNGIVDIEAGGSGLYMLNQKNLYDIVPLNPDIPAVASYIKNAAPNVKKVAFVGWDLGTAADNYAKSTLQTALAKEGATLDSFQLVPPGTQDFSSVATKLSQSKPDLIYTYLGATDGGYLQKQLAISGVSSSVLGATFIWDLTKVAGNTLDGYKFLAQFFDAENPPNPFAAYFVNKYNAKYGKSEHKPDYSAAYFFDVLFFWWQISRDVMGAGKSMTADNINAAIASNPCWNSTFGGTADQIAQPCLSTTTHSPEKMDVGLYEYKKGTVSRLAYMNPDGSNYRAAK